MLGVELLPWGPAGLWPDPALRSLRRPALPCSRSPTTLSPAQSGAPSLALDSQFPDWLRTPCVTTGKSVSLSGPLGNRPGQQFPPVCSLWSLLRPGPPLPPHYPGAQSSRLLISFTYLVDTTSFAQRFCNTKAVWSQVCAEFPLRSSRTKRGTAASGRLLPQGHPQTSLLPFLPTRGMVQAPFPPNPGRAGKWGPLTGPPTSKGL